MEARGGAEVWKWVGEKTFKKLQKQIETASDVVTLNPKGLKLQFLIFLSSNYQLIIDQVIIVLSLKNLFCLSNLCQSLCTIATSQTTELLELWNEQLKRCCFNCNQIISRNTEKSWKRNRKLLAHKFLFPKKVWCNAHFWPPCITQWLTSLFPPVVSIHSSSSLLFLIILLPCYLSECREWAAAQCHCMYVHLCLCVCVLLGMAKSILL